MPFFRYEMEAYVLARYGIKAKLESKSILYRPAKLGKKLAPDLQHIGPVNGFSLGRFYFEKPREREIGIE